MNTTYDIIIIGGGPAGLTAGLYACRARMKTVLIEKMMCGGQILIADMVENFPGFPDGIRGSQLGEWMEKQAAHFGLEILSGEAVSIVPGDGGGHHAVVVNDGRTLHAPAVIVSTGATWNALGVPGERELIGRGVSYCATCDGPMCRGREVVVVGGGDTAVGDALFLAKFAKKVTVVHRRDKLRATKILQERAFAESKLAFQLNSVVTRVNGETKVESVRLKDVKTGAEQDFRTDGVFVLIGMSPNSSAVKGSVGLDDGGYIITDDEMRTSRGGIFACGDVRKKLFRQVVTAAGDGATAAFSAERYIEGLNKQRF